MTDPTDEGFYVVLKPVGPYAYSAVDEIRSDPTKGLGVAKSVASVMDSELASEEAAAGIKHYCLPHPVGNRRKRANA